MDKKTFKLSMWLPLALLAVVGMSLGIISCNESNAVETEKKEDKAATKVLYVTHEPGRYHKYTPQKMVFQTIAKEQKWDLTVISGTYDEVIKKLSSTPNFADGFDVVVYNFCFASCADLNVPHNIITQTRDKGIPAMLVHCSLHSFWPTFKEKGGNAVHTTGAHAKAHTRKDLLEKWNKENPDKPFPAWPNFTGISSTAHGPRQPIDVTKVKADHLIVKDVPEYKTVKSAELYNNFINADDSKTTLPILKGTQGNNSEIILWEHPVGESKVVSFTLGHSSQEWGQPEFQKIMANTVNYLAKHPKQEKK